MLTKAQKTALVNEFVDILKNSEIVVFTDFKGMPVSDSNDLRFGIFKDVEGEIDYKVIRNSLLKTAIKKAELNVEDFEDLLVGNTGVYFVKEGDPITGLKYLTEFASKHNKLPNIKGGLLDGEVFGAEEAIELSKLPSKDELIAKLVGSINAPISGIVNVLAGTMRNMINVLNAIKDQK